MNVCDIILVQEVLLLDEDVLFLGDIDDGFDFISSPSKKSNSEVFDGCPSGGNAILWRKSLNIDINKIVYNEHFLISELIVNDQIFLLINVYMPYDDRSNRMCDEYQQILGELEACINDLGSSNIICVGDYNADPNRGRLWGCLWEFVTNGNLTVADLTLPVNSFIFLYMIISRFISNFRCSVCLIMYRVLPKRH